MKDAWSEENDKVDHLSNQKPVGGTVFRPSLLAGLSEPPDHATILGSLPSREASDRLIKRFFDAYNPQIPAQCK